MSGSVKLEFCQNFIHLKKQPITFEGRPYLDAIYGSSRRNLVVRASRQVEKSTFLANTIAYELIRNPGIAILYVSPRQEQARVFARSRFLPIVQDSPIIRRALLGDKNREIQVSNMRFANGSELFVRAAFHSGDAVRGLSADLLLIDEVQDIAAGDLPVLQETLTHSSIRRTILVGTPKLVENQLEAAFARSTANEWTIPCGNCQQEVMLDEAALGLQGIVCRHCQQPIDPATGRWVARNPESTWGDGFWLNHLMVPWVNHDEILERRQTYDLAKFKNEVLGQSTTLGEHIVTRAELEACCGKQPMATNLHEFKGAASSNIVVGIDWGGGSHSRTVVVVGYMSRDLVFHVGALFRYRADEDTDTLLKSVAAVCRSFKARWIAADGGGNGHFYNRLLLDRLKLPDMYPILYSSAGQEPRQDGSLWKWTVNRSATIGALFSRIKKRSIIFPCVSQCGSYLDEIACEVSTYDEINRCIRYTHPESTQDDALHATNYALLLAIRHHQNSASY